MQEKEKKNRKKKRRSDSDGVTVKRSYYSFSKYYPGGGSSQQYRKVMKETRDEKMPIKIAFAVIGLIIVIFIGYFTTTVALEVSYAPTTEVTEPVSQTQKGTDKADSEETTKPKKETTTKQTSESTTLEEPEREVNVTSLTAAVQEENTTEVTEPVTEIFTGY